MLTTSPVAAHALPDASDAHSFYYFKDHRRLTLDTVRVAILLAPEKGGATTRPDLSPFGLSASTVPAMAVRGWWFVETTALVRTDDAIERAVRQVAAGQAVDFVSPVFLDDRGEPIVLIPRILVGFDRRLDRSTAESILSAGEAPADGIAAWDGTSWSPLGSGLLNPTAGSFALTRRLDQARHQAGRTDLT